MKDEDGFPCGIAKNEKIMSTTVLAYSKHLQSLANAAYRRAQKDKDPEGYNRMMADRKREQRRKAKEAGRTYKPAPKLSKEDRAKMAVMEQYGYTVRRESL